MEDREKEIRKRRIKQAGTINRKDSLYLLSVIDSLRVELKNAKENLDITVEAHIETQQMWNKESKELRAEIEKMKKDSEMLNVCALPEVLKLRDTVEGLRKERDAAVFDFEQVKFIHDKNKELQSLLSDLVAAAEPFIKLEVRKDWSDKQRLFVAFQEIKYGGYDFTIGDLRTLSAAVDRVMEGKL